MPTRHQFEDAFKRYLNRDAFASVLLNFADLGVCRSVLPQRVLPPVGHPDLVTDRSA
jgi:hypothetical protein